MKLGPFREMPSQRAPRNGTHKEAILRFRRKKKRRLPLKTKKPQISISPKNAHICALFFNVLLDERRRTRRRRVGGETKIAREDTDGAWI